MGFKARTRTCSGCGSKDHDLRKCNARDSPNPDVVKTVAITPEEPVKESGELTVTDVAQKIIKSTQQLVLREVVKELEVQSG